MIFMWQKNNIAVVSTQDLVYTSVHANNRECNPPHMCRENTYDTVGPKEPTAMSGHVAIETNPAYGVCS